MQRADYLVVRFNEHLGDDRQDLRTRFPFVGERSTAKRFRLAKKPVGDGYVIVQAAGVEGLGSRILINGRNLPGVDLIPTGRARALDVVDVIPEDYFAAGDNTIQFRAQRGDNFVVHNVIVHWRESDE